MLIDWSHLGLQMVSSGPRSRDRKRYFSSWPCGRHDFEGGVGLHTPQDSVHAYRSLALVCFAVDDKEKVIISFFQVLESPGWTKGKIIGYKKQKNSMSILRAHQTKIRTVLILYVTVQHGKIQHRMLESTIAMTNGTEFIIRQTRFLWSAT